MPAIGVVHEGGEKKIELAIIGVMALAGWLLYSKCIIKVNSLSKVLQSVTSLTVQKLVAITPRVVALRRGSNWTSE